MSDARTPMTDVKETAERISTERLAKKLDGLAAHFEAACHVGDAYLVEENAADAKTLRDASAALRLLASRHAGAQEGGEVLNHAQRAYDILVSGKPPFSERECRASYALTYINGINLSPSAAPSNPVVSDADLRSFAETVDLIAEGDFYKDYDRAIAAIEPMRRILSALSVNPQNGSDKP